MTRYNLPLLLKPCHVSNPKQSKFPISVLPLAVIFPIFPVARGGASWLGPAPSPLLSSPPLPPSLPPSPPTHPPAEAMRLPQRPNSNSSGKTAGTPAGETPGGKDKVAARVRQQAQIQSRLTSPLLAAETGRRRPALIRRQSRSRSRSFPGVPTGSAPSCVSFCWQDCGCRASLRVWTGSHTQNQGSVRIPGRIRSGSACQGASSEF